MLKSRLTAALIILGSLFVSDAWADHDHIRRSYELQRIDLEQDYKARRDANKYAYHRDRDALHAARRRANRIDCRDTRALRVKAINRDLSALSREYHAANRAIGAWYRNERGSLRSSYEIALRNARRAATRPVIVDSVVEVPHPADCRRDARVPVVERKVVVETPTHVFERSVVESPALGRTHRHPADCHCQICEPPADACAETNFGRPEYYGSDFGPREFRGDPRNYRSTNYGRNPNALDWANLILSLVR